MLYDFPMLIPNKRFTSWKGSLSINGHLINVEIYCPDIPKLDNLEVCIPEIEKFNLYAFDLKDTVNTIKTKTNLLSDFVKDFVRVLN